MGPQGPNGNLGPGKTLQLKDNVADVALAGPYINEWRTYRWTVDAEASRAACGAFPGPCCPQVKPAKSDQKTCPRDPSCERPLSDRASRGHIGRPWNGLNTTQIGSS